LAVLGSFALLAPAQDIYNPAPAVPLQPGAAPAPAATQDLIFFTPDGPIRVRLTVAVGGKSAIVPWRTALDKLFAFCDRDGDGTLSAAERTAFRKNSVAYGDFILADGVIGSYSSGRQPFAFPERDGNTDRTMFGEGF